MRRSEASLAVIRRPIDGGSAWLALWNEKWDAFHFVGGHRRPDESPRQALAREVLEEVGLRDGVDCRVAPEPLAHLDYTAWSGHARAETEYAMDLFAVALGEEAAPILASNPGARWLLEGEIRRGRCRDGRPVSPSMAFLAARSGLLDGQDGPGSRDPSGGPAMGVGIVYSQAARRKLRDRLARELAADSSRLEATMDDLGRKLREVFREGRAVIVQDLYGGFRERPDEPILLVELSEGGDRDGVYVVKFGPPEKLEGELKNWRSCRPPGVRHDLVLMSVEPSRDPQGMLIALVYTDAQQLIGVDATLPLESALLDSARLGVPTPGSVADAIFQLYERLGLLLYRTSYVEDPDDPGYRFDPARLDKHLAANLEKWEAEDGPAFECRADASTYTASSPLRDHFRDPVSFLKFLSQGDGDGEVAPLAPALVPRLLRGRAHGDLHGRNVLIGRVGDRVLWPAVYDYGDMGPDNLVGRDFVKLEAEFKIRAYAHAFPDATTIPSFVPEVVKFEVDLFERTEACRDACRWPVGPKDETPRERLAWLILKIRQCAEAHLSTRRQNRGRDWLCEYYFLLAVYGISSVRFDNLTTIEFRAAYLSAGTACARYLYDREGHVGGTAGA